MAAENSINYNFKYLKETLDELDMLRTWDSRMDLKE